MLTGIVTAHVVMGGSFPIDRLMVVIVVEVTFRMDGDDVPRMNEARKVTETAEEDVDDGVGCTDAGFDPDCFD